MAQSHESIPELTVEALARSFFNEASTYGFQQVDYIRFVNLLLDCSMDNEKVAHKISVHDESVQTPISTFNLSKLPIKSDRIIIRSYNPKEDSELFKTWLNDESGRHFLLSQVTAKTEDFDELVADETNIIV